MTAPIPDVMRVKLKRLTAEFGGQSEVARLLRVDRSRVSRWLGGEKDGPDFPKLAKHIADTIPGAQLVLVPNAGHVLHFETPDVFNRELLKFLKTTL